MQMQMGQGHTYMENMSRMNYRDSFVVNEQQHTQSSQHSKASSARKISKMHTLREADNEEEEAAEHLKIKAVYHDEDDEKSNGPM